MPHARGHLDSATVSVCHPERTSESGMGMLTFSVGEDQTLRSGVPPAVSAVHGERVQEADFLEAREGVWEVILAAALHVREFINGPY